MKGLDSLRSRTKFDYICLRLTRAGNNNRGKLTAGGEVYTMPFFRLREDFNDSDRILYLFKEIINNRYYSASRSLKDMS